MAGSPAPGTLKMTNPTNAKGRFTRLDPREYLAANYTIDDASGCWNWHGNKFSHGYGQFKCKAFHHNPMAASRASWILHHGPIDSPRTFVCHTCDNRLCVNPEHLFLGTAQDNVSDMVKKGRNSRGASRPATSLNEDDVRSIREMRGQGLPYSAIARAFGISRSGAYQIAAGLSWKYAL